MTIQGSKMEVLIMVLKHYARLTNCMVISDLVRMAKGMIMVSLTKIKPYTGSGLEF